MASDTFGGFCVLAVGICAAKPATPHAMTKGSNFIPNLLLEELWLGDDTFDSILRLADAVPVGLRILGQLPGSGVLGKVAVTGQKTGFEEIAGNVLQRDF